MIQFPILNDTELERFNNIYYKILGDFSKYSFEKELDYTREFYYTNEYDKLIGSNKSFKQFVNRFTKYTDNLVLTDREAASFLKTCVDLGYYK